MNGSKMFKVFFCIYAVMVTFFSCLVKHACMQAYVVLTFKHASCLHALSVYMLMCMIAGGGGGAGGHVG